MDYTYDDDDEQMELPPGFRFHPTDEELISHYLCPKIFDTNFVARAIGEVDLNKIEPWDLPWNAKMGEEEWYFFSVRDRKYPTGMRTNRATEEGYWKATGKDKEIYEGKSLVGMKKTLVFYKGRAPNGIKTNWVMHEYRLDGKFSINNIPKSAQGDWVISRVFQKTSGGKKIPISGLCRTNKNNNKNELMASNLPPLMEIPCINGGPRTAINADTSQVTCYSESTEEHEPRNKDFFDSITTIRSKIENDVNSFQNTCFLPNQMVQNSENLQYQESVWMQDPSILRILIDSNNEQNMRLNPKIEMQDDPDYSMNLGGPMDLDSLWNY